MRRISPPVSSLIVVLSVLLFTSGALAQVWNNVGPYGGDARSFADSPSNPTHILLGTTNSWIYQTDDGNRWTRLSKISNSDTLVVDHILFDESNPNRLLVGAWRLDRPDGGVFISNDGGHKWTPVADMAGQSVRALAQAPSNSKVFIAGTLSGVFRSQDGGLHWSRISPMGSVELHEIESIAIDPVNPQVIYAGTWHLPWKTDDGGKTWKNIKQGLIVDSDVFSIIIDPKAPTVVYASACSGIYKSTDAGNQFHKIQGIPSAARRTRVLKQAPSDAAMVYAGTTEGLYRTTDSGTTWTLMTPKYLIINDLYVYPKDPQHILMATDRSGVLESEDGGKVFHAVNRGFSQRQISSMIIDPRNPATIYVGVLNDKQFGGVFVSKDAGQSWTQISAGLDGNDVYALAMSPSGNLLAGTNHGVFRLRDGSFQDVGDRLKAETHRVVHYHHRHRVVTRTVRYVPDGRIDGAVRSLAFADGQWYAATASGVYTSGDNGFVWKGRPLQRHDAFTGVVASGNMALANSPRLLYVSKDRGQTWQALTLPNGWTHVRHVAIDPSGGFWLGGRLGVAYSANQGQSWQSQNVPMNDISGLRYDSGMKRVVVTSYDSDLVFGINPQAKNWIWWNPGWRTHVVGSSDGHLVAATLLHGVIVQAEKQTASGGF